jgi:hypothetical protein
VSTQQPVRTSSPYQILLQAVQDGIDAEAFMARADYGAEEIAYSLWALAHGMAMLQQTHLRQFQSDFTAIDRRAFEVFVHGLSRS